ncbi:MAG: hypothetical protein R3Y64_06605 [Peptostreptococcaceae bacterium]
MKNILIELVKNNQITVSENKSSYPSDILSLIENILNYNDSYTTKFNNMESLLGIKNHLMNFQYENMSIFIETEDSENKKTSTMFYELLEKFEKFSINYINGNLGEASINDSVLIYGDKSDLSIKDYIIKVYQNEKVYEDFLNDNLYNSFLNQIKSSNDLANHLLAFIDKLESDDLIINTIKKEIIKFK